MIANYDEVQNAVIEVLSEIQTNNGQSLPEINEATCPSTDLPGFDSLHGVEASALLSERLGCAFTPGLLLPQTSGEPPLSVKDMVARVIQELETQERKNHGRTRFPKEGHS